MDRTVTSLVGCSGDRCTVETSNLKKISFMRIMWTGVSDLGIQVLHGYLYLCDLSQHFSSQIHAASNRDAKSPRVSSTRPARTAGRTSARKGRTSKRASDPKVADQLDPQPAPNRDWRAFGISAARPRPSGRIGSSQLVGLALHSSEDVRSQDAQLAQPIQSDR